MDRTPSVKHRTVYACSVGQLAAIQQHAKHPPTHAHPHWSQAKQPPKGWKISLFLPNHFTCIPERNQETNTYLRMHCLSEILTCQRVCSHCTDEPRVKTINSASFLYYVSLTLPKHNAIAFCFSRLAFLCLSVSRCADEQKIKPRIFPHCFQSELMHCINVDSCIMKIRLQNRVQKSETMSENLFILHSFLISDFFFNYKLNY